MHGILPSLACCGFVLLSTLDVSVAFRIVGLSRMGPVRRSMRLAGDKVGVLNAALSSRRPSAVSSRSSRRILSSSSDTVSNTDGSSKASAKKRPRQKRAPSETPPPGELPSVTAGKKLKTVTTLGRARENRKIGEGFGMVIGVDEAGRGPFAGPVVAAACFVPPDARIPGIQDSKKVTKHEDREALFAELTAAPGVLWATSEVASGRIDEINILEATKEAMSNCALEVCSQASKGIKPFVFVDGNFVPPGLSGVDAECVVGGDGLEHCIAAASIIAKVTRDRTMIAYGKRWPIFGFEKHKGYGTAAHRDAIRKHGMVKIHRRSFVKKMEAVGGKLDEYTGGEG